MNSQDPIICWFDQEKLKENVVILLLTSRYMNQVNSLDTSQAYN